MNCPAVPDTTPFELRCDGRIVQRGGSVPWRRQAGSCRSYELYRCARGPSLARPALHATSRKIAGKSGTASM